MFEEFLNQNVVKSNSQIPKQKSPDSPEIIKGLLKEIFLRCPIPLNDYDKDYAARQLFETNDAYFDEHISYENLKGFVRRAGEYFGIKIPDTIYNALYNPIHDRINITPDELVSYIHKHTEQRQLSKTKFALPFAKNFKI